MTNSKIGVRTPNIRPPKHGDIDEQHWGNLNKDFNLHNGSIIF